MLTMDGKKDVRATFIVGVILLVVGIVGTSTYYEHKGKTAFAESRMKHMALVESDGMLAIEKEMINGRESVMSTTEMLAKKAGVDGVVVRQDGNVVTVSQLSKMFDIWNLGNIAVQSTNRWTTILSHTISKNEISLGQRVFVSYSLSGYCFHGNAGTRHLVTRLLVPNVNGYISGSRTISGNTVYWGNTYAGYVMITSSFLGKDMKIDLQYRTPCAGGRLFGGNDWGSIHMEIKVD